MASQFSILQLGKVLFRPNAAFAYIADHGPSSVAVFFGFALWLGLFPPLFAYIGTMTFGWRLGVEPLFLPAPTVARDCGGVLRVCCCSDSSARPSCALDGDRLTVPTSRSAAALR